MTLDSRQWQSTLNSPFADSYAAYNSGMGSYNQPAQQLPWQSPDYAQPQGQSQSGNGFGDLTSSIQGLMAANYMRKGQNLAPEQGIANQISGLANASYDINDPRYKQIYNDEMQSNQQNLAESINEAMRQNRKATLLGRQPLFAQGREGEMAFRTLAGGYSANQDAARARARQIIGAGQQAQSNALQAAQQMGAARQGNKASKTNSMLTLASLLKFM